MDTKYNVLDLFSGAGGLTEGFCNSGCYNMVSHVEMNESAAQTLETRMYYYALKEKKLDWIYTDYMENFGQKDARQRFITLCKEHGISETGVIAKPISDETQKDIFNSVTRRLGKDKIDIIIGGPPCQAYSSIGRWKQGRDCDYSDERLYLYKQYMSCLREFGPKMFIFENVPGLLTIANGYFFKKITEGMNKEGYEFKEYHLDAANFGVCQHRNRIIIVGKRKDESLEFPDLESVKKNPGTISELILQDLPVLDAGGGEQVMEYSGNTTRYLIDAGLRDSKQNILLQHYTRPHCERDLEIYKYAIQALNEGRKIKYTDIPEEFRTHKNQTCFLDRFKVLNRNKPSHALVAHISKDGHHYIHPDINHPRSISVREAARIQSFPDDFIFEGSRTAQFTQIGNAVPPLMAKGIAEEIRKLLEKE